MKFAPGCINSLLLHVKLIVVYILYVYVHIHCYTMLCYFRVFTVYPVLN